MNPQTLKVGALLRHKYIRETVRPELENAFEVVAISDSHISLVQLGADRSLPTHWPPAELAELFEPVTADLS